MKKVKIIVGIIITILIITIIILLVQEIRSGNLDYMVSDYDFNDTSIITDMTITETDLATNETTVLHQGSDVLKTLNVTINTRHYSLTLYNSETSKEFLEIVPLTINATATGYQDRKIMNITSKVFSKDELEETESVKSGDVYIDENNNIVFFITDSTLNNEKLKLIAHIDREESFAEIMQQEETPAIHITISSKSVN